MTEPQHNAESVTVTELRSRLDSLVVALNEEAREAGVETPLKASREYFAVVECDDKREVWPISKGDAERIADAAEDFYEPVVIDLPRPMRGAPGGWDSRLVLSR